MTSQHENAPNPADELYLALDKWRDHLIGKPEALDALLAGVEAEETPDGTIYPVEGLFAGDAAVVDFANVAASDAKTDTPHKHVNGELEGHLIVRGSMTMYLATGESSFEVKLLNEGDSFVVPSDTDHFVAPSPDCLDLVAGFPSYNEENQVATPEDSHLMTVHNRLASITRLASTAIEQAQS